MLHWHVTDHETGRGLLVTVFSMAVIALKYFYSDTREIRRSTEALNVISFLSFHDLPLLIHVCFNLLYAVLCVWGCRYDHRSPEIQILVTLPVMEFPFLDPGNWEEMGSRQQG